MVELIHSDVCGPLKVKTIGGTSYFVTFIDDYSRKLWVFALKTKDHVLPTFKELHASVERDTDMKIKYVRSDNGGEYIVPFDVYCKEQGIKHQKTPLKMTQLNDISEQMNRTLMESAVLSGRGVATGLILGRGFIYDCLYN